MSVFFPVGSVDGDMVCVQVSTLDDFAFEKEEFFNLHMSSEFNVAVRTPYVTLQIVDDEGEFSISLCAFSIITTKVT